MGWDVLLLNEGGIISQGSATGAVPCSASPCFVVGAEVRRQERGVLYPQIRGSNPVA